MELHRTHRRRRATCLTSLAAFTMGLPSGSLVHIGYSQLREPDGYLFAPVQEALLECFNWRPRARIRR